MSYLRPFDPWGSRLCTCPPKFSLQPYTGCAHACLYCYAQTYVKDFHQPRIKKDFLKRVARDLKKLPPGSLISLSNSSDPYQPLEDKHYLTRSFLELLLDTSHRLLVLTKSTLVLRDIDLLKELPSAVSLTLTSFSLATLLEPKAPPTEERLFVIKELKKLGLKVIARIDPIFPLLTEEEALELTKTLIPYADHFVFSTLKIKKPIFRFLGERFPKIVRDYAKIYFEEGEVMNGSWYLPRARRIALLSPLIQEVKKAGKSFGLCREGLFEFKSKNCDGSYLI